MGMKWGYLEEMCRRYVRRYEKGQTTVFYFVRHAQPNYENHNDELRELSPKGLEDRKLVTDFLEDKQIDVVLSSPFLRAVETVRDFAEKYHLEIQTVDDFRERKVGDEWIDNFTSFCRCQWEDFSYKLPSGESLREVQNRNIAALKWAMELYENKNIVVGSHGTALSTIIHYFNPTFGYEEFEEIRLMMPWVVKFVFEQGKLLEIEKIDVFDATHDSGRISCKIQIK